MDKNKLIEIGLKAHRNGVKAFDKFLVLLLFERIRGSIEHEDLVEIKETILSKQILLPLSN